MNKDLGSVLPRMIKGIFMHLINLEVFIKQQLRNLMEKIVFM